MRKQVCGLTAGELDQHSLREFVLDEVGKEGQDEAPGVEQSGGHVAREMKGCSVLKDFRTMGARVVP
jgi:hypothetical protein